MDNILAFFGLAIVAGIWIAIRLVNTNDTLNRVIDQVHRLNRHPQRY